MHNIQQMEPHLRFSALKLRACVAAHIHCLAAMSADGPGTLMYAQGTTCVFSKKVEYLHSLVYQALETIFNKKQKERQAAANRNKVGGRRIDS
jgi:hypothetical protein